MTKRSCIISKDSGRTARRTESFDQKDQSVNSLQRCENYTKGVGYIQNS